jgi:hypothetical protein
MQALNLNKFCKSWMKGFDIGLVGTTIKAIFWELFCLLEFESAMPPINNRSHGQKQPKPPC